VLCERCTRRRRRSRCCRSLLLRVNETDSSASFMRLVVLRTPTALLRARKRRRLLCGTVVGRVVECGGSIATPVLHEQRRRVASRTRSASDGAPVVSSGDATLAHHSRACSCNASMQSSKQSGNSTSCTHEQAVIWRRSINALLQHSMQSLQRLQRHTGANQRIEMCRAHHCAAERAAAAAAAVATSNRTSSTRHRSVGASESSVSASE
jgi:hypothetical protein